MAAGLSGACGVPPARVLEDARGAGFVIMGLLGTGRQGHRARPVSAHSPHGCPTAGHGDFGGARNVCERPWSGDVGCQEPTAAITASVDIARHKPDPE